MNNKQEKIFIKYKNGKKNTVVRIRIYMNFNIKKKSTKISHLKQLISLFFTTKLIIIYNADDDDDDDDVSFVCH